MSRCECDLRIRQWNGHGKCLACQCRYEDDRFDQPRPTPNTSAAIVDLVLADIRERDRIGRLRYGTRLQANNGRDAMLDAYHEALDLALYLRQCIEERKAAP
jgi:hypothetical protein